MGLRATFAGRIKATPKPLQPLWANLYSTTPKVCVAEVAGDWGSYCTGRIPAYVDSVQCSSAPRIMDAVHVECSTRDSMGALHLTVDSGPPNILGFF
ncbi:hypothetical protein PM082_023689 [Marasmius tenuissimus]|nr:hypothetical protein PM082_023689 [Marasmius tenuissimus]